MNPHPPSANTAIRNVLVILGSAVALAGLLVFCLVVYYSPTGSYKAGNVMLSPEVLGKMTYEQANPGTGQVQRFVYDAVDFTYYRANEGGAVTKGVRKERYTKVYKLLQSDSSVSTISRKMEEQFNGPRVAYLTLWVHPEGNVGPARALYRVYFPAMGNVYRVENLQDSAVEEPWIYFLHDNVYEQVLEVVGVEP